MFSIAVHTLRIQSLRAAAVFSVTHQEQQVVVCQILQQQQQRELQRLTLSGALTSTPNSPKVAQSPSLLSSATASPMQASQGGSLFGLQDNPLHKPGVSDRLMIPCYSSCVTKEKHELLCRCFQAAGEKSGDKNGWNWFLLTGNTAHRGLLELQLTSKTVICIIFLLFKNV